MISKRVKKAVGPSAELTQSSPFSISAFDWVSKATWPQLRTTEFFVCLV